MAIPKNILKEWFSNLKKPPEEQFWGWQDAFWHKLEMITISSIENLSNILSKKADLVDGVVPENQLPFSALTSEIISLGDVSVVGNKTNLAVHSSGANKVRVKGPIITRTFPNQWTITPVVADGTKVLRGYAVKGEPDFFLAEGPELPEITEPEIPAGALELFKITMNLGGSTVVVPASGYKLKQESNWQNIAIKSNASPVILDQPSDVRGSFYLTKSLGVGEITIEAIKRLSSGTVAKDYMYGGRELLLFNATGGNIIIDSSGAADSDSYFFSNRITPFTLKNDTGILVKLRGDVLELLPSGSDPDLSPYALKATTVNGKPLSANVSLTTSDINEGTNLYFTTARVLATVLTGISFVTGTAVLSTDTILVAFGKVQKQITDILATVSGNTSAITALQAQTQVYKTISGNVTIDDSYHNAIVWITANSIITVNTTLRADFNCVFFVIGTFTGTITDGSGVTFISPNGLVIGNNSSAHLSRYIANQFVLM